MFDDSSIEEIQHQIKHKFSAEEDERLRELVEVKKLNFKQISKLMPGRSTRQCRERWKYFLCPDINKEEWTPEEDEILLENYNKFGTKWAIIANFLDSRTGVDTKNRYQKLFRMEKRGKRKNIRKSSKKQIVADSSPNISDDDYMTCNPRRLIELPLSISRLVRITG